MRFLHEVIDDLDIHAEEPATTPMGHVLEELLGGERGSLPDLAGRFRQQGLEQIMTSWVGDGPKLPIKPEELRHCLGEERVQDMATLAGMPSAALLERLCDLLPRVVHAMTREDEPTYLDEEMQRRE